MENSKKIIAAAAGIVVLCVCAVVIVPLVTGNESTTGMISSSSPVATPDTGTGTTAPPINDEIPDDAPAMNPQDGNFTPEDGMPPDGSPVMDEEHAGEMLQMLEESGIDTTEAELALENGDMDFVLAFIQENMPAGGGPGGAGPEDRQAPPTE